MPSSLTWQELCAAKKQSQTDSLPKEWLLPSPPPATQLNVMDIPRTCGILTEKELEITETVEVPVILKNLKEGIWSCVEVTTAFCKRAVIAHQLVNCLTEFWIPEALSRAAELDASRTRGDPLGPLFGLPISLKDQFDVAGKECNMGFASWIGRISERDAALVTVLKNAGAVIYVRTNIPQTLMRPETDNLVYGLTTNPRNRALGAGGSSGGEGALVAMRGSPLGVGTDIGGSVRIPSASNGLYGLRPTMRRLPYGGASNTFLGLEAIESSLGPMSNSLSSCVEFFKAVVNSSSSDLDPKVVEMPWREDLYQLTSKGGKGSKLSFGYYETDGEVTPHPPVTRGLREAAEALRKAGHEVIPWKPLKHKEGVEIANRIFASDSNVDFTTTTSALGEPINEFALMEPYPELSVYDSWQLNKRKDALRKEYLDAWMATASQTSTGRPIDAIICPTHPHTAAPHEQYKYGGYTMIFNTLDLPSAVLPVGTVDTEVDLAIKGYQPLNDLDEVNMAMYNPEVFRDSPVTIQVVGRRFKEEELLAICEEVDKALKA